MIYNWYVCLNSTPRDHCAEMVDWCNKTIGDSLIKEEWNWCRFEFSMIPTFYFSKAEDALAFSLRFGL